MAGVAGARSYFFFLLLLLALGLALGAFLALLPRLGRRDKPYGVLGALDQLLARLSRVVIIVVTIISTVVITIIIVVVVIVVVAMAAPCPSTHSRATE